MTPTAGLRVSEKPRHKGQGTSVSRSPEFRYPENVPPTRANPLTRAALTAIRFAYEIGQPVSVTSENLHGFSQSIRRSNDCDAGGGDGFDRAHPNSPAQ